MHYSSLYLTVINSPLTAETMDGSNWVMFQGEHLVVVYQLSGNKFKAVVLR